MRFSFVNLRNILRCSGILLCIIMAIILPTAWVVGSVLPTALADGERTQLDIHMTAKPDHMVEPGDVMLNFTIKNTSISDAANVYLSSADGLLSEPVGHISSGETQSFNRQHAASQEELDAGEITYIISHDDPSDPDSKVNYTISAVIRRSDALPEVEFTRQFSSLLVEENGTLTITYRVRNIGNVPLVNMRIQDTLGDYTGKIERLEVGESRTLISRAIIKEDTVSSATLDYGADGNPDEIHTQSLADATISIAHSGLESSYSVGPSAFNPGVADVVLSLNNTGNTDINNICIYDEIYGGIIADSLHLPVGSGPLEVVFSYPIREEMNFRWHVSAVDISGKAMEFTTETLTYGTEDKLDASVLRIDTTIHTPKIRRSGNIKLTVRIANPGGTDVQDVVLSEASLGELRTFAVIPADDSVMREFSYYISEDTVYNFSISYINANGQLQNVTAAPVGVAIAPDGVLPEGTKPAFIEFTGKSIKIGGSSTFAVLLIAGFAVLLVLIIMLLIASRRARIQRQLRIAAEKQRRKEEMGKTNRFTPVRAPKSKSKGRN